MEIKDLPELHINGASYVRTDNLAGLPATAGWMHSGCAITDDGTVVVAHPEGRRLVLLEPDGTSRVVPVPALEMHCILHESDGQNESLWLVNNGHRFVHGSPDYEHYRERGTVIRVTLRGEVVQEIPCPAIEAYAREKWQPTSICREGDGGLWVADGYGLNLVHRFSASGEYVETIDGSETGVPFACPHGIAARGEDLLVADRTNRRIVVLRDGRVFKILAAPLTSPSSLLVLGGWVLVTELHGGLAVFHDDEYIGHYARSADDPSRDAWPNDRDPVGQACRPRVGGELHSPHGIASDDERIIVTEWMIGGRVNQFVRDATSK
nr:hypothetical protein [Propionicimonas sp.]